MTTRALKVISNTAISLDGRIDTGEDRFVPLGSAEDRRRIKVIRRQADAVLVGGATFRHWPRASLPDPPPAEPPWNVIVSRTLDVPLDSAFINDARVRPLFLTRTDAIPIGFPAAIEGHPGPDVPIPWILDRLEARGVRTLLVEAGGDLLYQFVAAGALDEMYVTLCPRLVGARSAASLLRGPGFPASALPSLHLLAADVVGDEIFLHYSVVR